MRDDQGSERVRRRGHRHPRAGRHADGRLLPLAGRPVRHGAGRDRAAGVSSRLTARASPAGRWRSRRGRLAEATLHAADAPGRASREIVRSTASGSSFVRIARPPRGAQRGDVGDRREAEHDGEEEQAHLLGERDDRDDAADHPHELEARLELGERAPAHGVGTVALQAGCRTRAARPRRRSPTANAASTKPTAPADQRTEQREDGGEHERRREDHLFAHRAPRARARRSHRRSCRRRPRRRRHRTRTRSSLSENAAKNSQEADARPQHGHRARPEQDARLCASRPARAAARCSSAGSRQSRPRDLDREDRRDRRTRPRRSAATSRRRRACGHPNAGSAADERADQR